MQKLGLGFFFTFKRNSRELTERPAEELT